MWLLSLRDLQWRKRRFAIAIVITAVVFAMTLILSGVSASFTNEVTRTVAAMHADAFVVPRGASGPFTSTGAFPEAAVQNIRRIDGVERADPFTVSRLWIGGGHGKLKDVNLLGYRPGGLGAPHVEHGRLPTNQLEVVADDRLHENVGTTIDLGGHRAKVVGDVHGTGWFAGTPAVYVQLSDAQRLSFAGQHLISGIAISGRINEAPRGMKVMSNAQVRADLRRPLISATQSLQFISVLLWLVAAGVIGSIVYLTSLDRLRDMAVCKAIGVGTRGVAATLLAQAVLLALTAAAISAVLARLLQPTFPLSVEIPAAAWWALPVIAVGIGAVSSVAALRRAIAVDPAIAFGGA
jgi:putative ABC transport system permease protein